MNGYTPDWLTKWWTAKVIEELCSYEEKSQSNISPQVERERERERKKGRDRERGRLNLYQITSAQLSPAFVV